MSAVSRNLAAFVGGAGKHSMKNSGMSSEKVSSRGTIVTTALRKGEALLVPSHSV
jgi:hypothetical protein